MDLARVQYIGFWVMLFEFSVMGFWVEGIKS